MNFFLNYFERYGYWIVFLIILITILETTVFIGVVVPGEILVLAASFFSAQSGFNIVYVFLAAALGNIIGNNLSYFFGKSGGRALLERYGHNFFISSKTIKAAEHYFDKHGAKTVFFGRFVPVVKAFSNALAGAAKMTYGKFFVYSTAAVIIWVGIFVALGFLFGEQWALIISIINRIGGGFFIFLVGAVLIFYFYRRRKRLKTYSE